MLVTSMVLLFVVVGGADDRRADKAHLRIMTLNAEFLWDGQPPEEGQADFPWKNSESEAREHMRSIAGVITRNNPDIVNLVEVENENALGILNSDFLPGRGYRPYFVQGKDTTTGQDVAVLTRIDPEDGAIARYDGSGRSGSVTKSVSKNYYAKFDIEGQKLALIGLHLLAHPNRQDYKLPREAQADAMRTLALDLRAAGYLIVIAGDFNDYDGAEDGRDHVDSMPITNVLRLLRELDPASTVDNLANVASSRPKADRYTAFWDKDDDGVVDYPGELTSIDHILIAPELVAKVSSVDIPHDYLPNQVTDHFPVLVTLTIGKGEAPAGVRIIRLVPNPRGDETRNEEVTLKNHGPLAVDLSGWKLRDLAGTFWVLSELGTLSAGEKKTIKRGGQQMALNNGGDTIELLDPQGQVTQSVIYGKAEEDEVVSVEE